MELKEKAPYLSYITRTLSNPRKSLPLFMLIMLQMLLIAYGVVFYLKGVSMEEIHSLLSYYLLIALLAEGWILTKPIIEEVSTVDNAIMLTGYVATILGIINSIDFLYKGLHLSISDALLDTKVISVTLLVSFIATIFSIALGNIIRYLIGMMRERF